MKKMLLIITAVITIYSLLVPTTFAQSDASPPTIVSEAAIVMDAKSGEVIYEKNAKAQKYPASLTKIATAIYTIENADLDEKVTVSKNARHTEGTRVYLEEGEQVTLKKLLQGLLINSGNDAGVAIAEHLSGTVDQFATEINNYLKNDIGVKNTHFKNPHGLFNSEHVTTAEDLATITRYAMENEVFRNIFGTKKFEWSGEAWDTTLFSHHKLMRKKPYEEIITGGKTGYVDQSGFTLATTAKKENVSLIIITLNSDAQRGAYNDTMKLLEYGFGNFETSSIPKGTTFVGEGTDYITSKKLYFTHPLNEQVKKEVKEDGSLHITDQNGKILSSFQLSEINNDTEDVRQAKSMSTVDSGLPMENQLPNLFISIGLSIVDLFYKYT
ncbi:D-alanyl-D-alanine carboxypeptidase [Halobacillus shinanisalinarum]|uniref:D-alanyl-D-alanine carboxypeptidase n=1 Tax=Halobacillus shinanisalinarum TaxID=2932258 RepID=A0ABY4H1Q6_9BACI|nr:D-alanyl-D-alanine carboxypeptidase family protein [Halobacillus shinanisalinarum]UOQ94378.1 D-alanyl-D-alanine carboxypeptidase [Halobacillus shinanisalinarum]